MSGGLPRPQGHPLGSCGEDMAVVLAITNGRQIGHGRKIDIDAHHESQTGSVTCVEGRHADGEGSERDSQGPPAMHRECAPVRNAAWQISHAEAAFEGRGAGHAGQVSQSVQAHHREQGVECPHSCGSTGLDAEDAGRDQSARERVKTARCA